MKQINGVYLGDNMFKIIGVIEITTDTQEKADIICKNMSENFDVSEATFRVILQNGTRCCKCDFLIDEDEMPRCYIDGKGKNAEVTCQECCKWLDPIDRNRIG